MVRHIVWDWNGTLFDDGQAVFRASNEVFTERGLPTVTLEQYRAAYTRPISLFYRRLLGFEPSAVEMAEMDEQFHAAYRRVLLDTELTSGAREALASWRDGGGTQSLLSMFRHTELVPLVRRHGIEAAFNRIDGLVGDGGGLKAEHLRRHLHALGALAPERVLLIGDSLDDAAAAASVGAGCVLYDGGSHERADLESSGLPVAATLTEALVLAA